MLSVAEIRHQFVAAKQAPIPYVLAAVICAGAVWWFASTIDTAARAGDAAALTACNQQVAYLRDRLTESNRELDQFKKTVVTKINTAAPQLPPSFATELEQQVTTDLAKIRKSNTTTLEYTFGKSGKTGKTGDMNFVPLPEAPKSPPATKSGTVLPEIH